MSQPTLSDVEYILARAFSMEQYMTTQDAREAILRKLMEIYRRGQSESLALLRDLADLQNGPPLASTRKEWEEVMARVDTQLAGNSDRLQLNVNETRKI
jgi:acyl-CoA reductase-like NAD-dependent aldehyde dehydrogenase